MEPIEGASLSAACDQLQSAQTSVSNVDLQTWLQTVSTTWAEARLAEKSFNPLAGGHYDAGVAGFGSDRGTIVRFEEVSTPPKSSQGRRY